MGRGDSPLFALFVLTDPPAAIMPLCPSLSHNSRYLHQQQQSPQGDFTDLFFPTHACASYSTLGAFLRVTMTNAAIPEDRTIDGINQSIHPDIKVISSPGQFRTSSSAEDSEEVVIVQPSFDDHGALGSTGYSSPPERPKERQSRSPAGDGKNDEEELRNPSSPEHQGKHSRNLSDLFGATTISDDIAAGVHIESDVVSRKHRRIFSGDVSNPNLAHRRLNSIGTTATVSRRHHHREGSEGLDILSAAADATKEEIAAVAGSEPGVRQGWEYTQHPRPSLGQVSTSSSSYLPSQVQHGPMEPPPQRQRGHHPSLPHPSTNPNFPPHYPTGNTANSYHHYPVVHPHQGNTFFVHQYPPPHYSQQQPEYYKGSEYGSGSRPQDLEASHYAPGPRPKDMEASHYPQSIRGPSEWESHPKGAQSRDNVALTSTHQGAQTYVTAIAVGQGHRVVTATTHQKNAGTNTEPSQPSVPSKIGHHRKMSSFSSLGTIIGSSIFPSPSDAPDTEGTKKKGHHRASSSSVSFLNGLEVGIDDATFLRNLQASNASATSYRNSPPPAQPLRQIPQQAEPPIQAPPPDDSDVCIPIESQSGILKLAEGGTSKRLRRKCTAPGCGNRVVQGGLCIQHGAKRKICTHPGCSKNVKKAGLCSTHGPARKRCEHPDCSKVAVQGGRCIAHGAKKKLCFVDGCAKQAILNGMCKKHHDHAQNGRKSPSESEDFCRPVPTSNKKTHTRGLSIFQEMSADAVSSLLNDPNASDKTPEETPAAPPSW